MTADTIVTWNDPPVNDRAVWEPWIPEVGMYVRVTPGPECRSWHSTNSRAVPPIAYGRVELIDREYDDPDGWVTALCVEDGLSTSEAEARQDARNHVGHYYYVNDALDGSRTAYLDGHYAACELTPVPEAEAVAAIVAARADWWPLSPDERLCRILGIGLRP